MNRFAMKPKPHSVSVVLAAWIAAGLAAVGLPATVHAHGPGWYAHFAMGGSIATDSNMEEFFTEPVASRVVEFDPGFRFDAAVGYRFNDFFSLEMETGYSFNTVNSISGATLVDDMSVSQVPFLLNGVVQLHNRSRFTPYFGAGGGGSISVVDADFLQIGGVGFSGTTGGATWAWQAFAGLRYEINDQMTAGLQYKFSGFGDVDWEPDVFTGTAGEFGISAYEIHAFTINFSLRF
jgi:opacity protein-like surface antigen